MENPDDPGIGADAPDADEMDEHIARLPDDAKIRQWLACLPPYLADFAKNIPAEDLGMLLRAAIRSELDDPEFAVICKELGSGGRLKLLSAMMASMDEDGHLLLEILLGHGPSQEMIKRDLDAVSAGIGQRALELLIETPGFIPAVKIAMPLVSRSPSMPQFARQVMERTDG